MTAGLTPESQKLIEVVKNLRAAGVEPILVGGLALILYGSERVTFDCDLVSSRPETLEQAKKLGGALHAAKCYYVTRFDKRRRPVSWIDNDNIAAARLMIDEPDTVFFWNAVLEMKIGVLLDFPLKSSDLLAAAQVKKLDKSTTIKVAGLKHLKTMKEIAARSRKLPRTFRTWSLSKRIFNDRLKCPSFGGLPAVGGHAATERYRAEVRG